jgi:hypothetical protein
MQFCTFLTLFPAYRGYEARKSYLLLPSGLFGPFLLNGPSKAAIPSLGDLRRPIQMAPTNSIASLTLMFYLEDAQARRRFLVPNSALFGNRMITSSSDLIETA